MLLGAAVVDEVLVPVLTTVVCSATVVDTAPEEIVVSLARLVDAAPEEALVSEVSAAPVLVGAEVESSVAVEPGAALSFSRPAVMVTGTWKVRNG